MLNDRKWRLIAMTTSKRLFICLMCIGINTLKSAGQTGSRPVDDFVLKFMQDAHIPGLSVAVIKDGSILDAKGYGMANLETSTPATAMTVYKTASLSKMVIADAVLLLEQAGKLTLDDKVSRYLDDTPESWKEITIRNLLTHTSGIVRDPSDYHPYREQPLMDVIGSAYAVPLKFQPDEGWLYSNIGYYALAEIITKASGKPWEQFIAEKLFIPAYMSSTRTTTAIDIIPNRARGYHWTGQGQINAEDWIAVRPSGAFLSTVLDLAKWDAFLNHGSPVSEANRKLSWTSATLKNGEKADYGFGWDVSSFLTHSRIHHDGQFPGFRADYERLDNGKLTIIVLANSDHVSLESFALKIAGFYNSEFLTPPFTINVVTSESAKTSTPLAVAIAAKDDGSVAPNSVVEMEIWDSSGKPVYKQHKANENFTSGETRNYSFIWTPQKAGSYTINVGVYGPGWVPSYTWKVNAALIAVQ